MIDVKRRVAAPAGLAQRALRARDVLEALHVDFLGKCYLCESHVSPGGFEVDHRVQRSHDASREYDWTNLFPICEGCNKRRRKKPPVGGLLDPASGEELIAHKLEQRIVDRHPHPPRPYFRSLDPANVAARNTADELDHIHNDPNDPGAMKAKDLRDAVVYHQHRVFKICLQYLRSTGDEQARRELGEHLRELLSRRAPYTALTRAELAAMGPEIVALFD
ncbi:HNH endonuclease signature motif containing protein [Nannocystis sp.]|uniref:HNH endonuclease n=1 Tax=Nannocystis sp. TaxID=1962667 RepID=UPI0024217A9E|nr:HNH endonuclease signature motif containing protein [Nannocystis sp.]MBK7828250.1 HNH endonuclease [Nannocystis sp.]MBK9757374.1 HNH endonuclease [Nannocystis sp.]